MPDILVSGYYGFGNAGDEVLLGSMLHDLRREVPRARIQVLSMDPEATAQLHRVEAVPRFEPPAVWRAVQRCQLFISGGGSLLQDATSLRSLAYYAGLILLARQTDRQVMIYANGLGPLRTPVGRALARKALEAADIITLRDNRALELVQELGVRARGHLEVTADPAFNLPLPSAHARETVRREYGLEGRQPLLLALRPWENLTYSLDLLLESVSGMATEHNLTPVMLPMHRRQDTRLAEVVASSIDGAVLVRSDHPADELLALFSEARLVVGMRLHALILAVRCGVPAVGLAYDPKVKGFMERVQQPCFNLSDISNEGLTSLVQSLFAEHENVCRNLQGQARQLRARSRRNGQLAAKLARETTVARALI